MSRSDDPLVEKVSRFAERRAGKREVSLRSLWREVARVGTLGWMIAIPVAGMALLGHLIDRRLGGGVRWALGFMMVGLLVGGYSLWRIVGERVADREESDA